MLQSPGLLADEPIPVEVAAPYIEWHTGPGRGYPIVNISEKGELIYLLKQRTDWVKARDKRGQTGWIKRSALADTLLNGLPYEVESNRDSYVTHRWQIGGSAGEFGGAEALGLYLGYRVTPNISTELKISQATGNFSDSKMVYLAVVHQPFPQRRLSPFFTLGGGKIRTTPNTRLVQSEDRTDSTLMVGAGAFYYLSRRFILRVEYNNHLSLTSRDENEETNEWKVGFTAFF